MVSNNSVGSVVEGLDVGARQAVREAEAGERKALDGIAERTA